MCNKLWFLTQNDLLVDVYDEEDFAVEMKLFHNNESINADYSVYCINTPQLAKFPAEFDFARDRGFLHD